MPATRRFLATALALLSAVVVLLAAGCVVHKPVPPDNVASDDVQLAGNVAVSFQTLVQTVLACPDLAPVGLLLGAHAVRIEAPQGPRDLLQVVAASGSRYEAGGTELWLKGEAAMYRQGGEDIVRDCRVEAVTDAWESAALRGVAFRAVGNEPGWFAEVLPDKWILLVTDYGERRLVVPPVAAVSEADGTQRFRPEGEAPPFDLRVTPGACSDGMSDTDYDTRVSLLFEGRVLQGCGRWLQP